MLARTLVGTLLLAHGAVHLFYLMPAPENDASWPFSLDESWVVPGSARRGVGLAAAVAIAAVYLLVALAIWGVPGMEEWLRPLLIAGSIASLTLFAAYWHPWLSIGTAIAAGLLMVTVVRYEWWQRLIES